MSETLSGIVERVTFHNPENGFAVLRVKLPGRRDLATVVGNVTSVMAGEHLEATGCWRVDRDHGQQFQADELTTAHPATAEGIERYLAAGAIRSIGPQLASRIVGIYKERTLEVFDKSPDFLLHVTGIGPKRLKRIRESWAEQREVRQIMLFLQECGIGFGGRAVRIFRTYGHQAVAKIKANPFQLADDIRGIGFKTADQIADRLGMDPLAPERARAAVGYCLAELTQEGHCGYAEQGVLEKTQELVGIPRGVIEDAVEYEIAHGNLIRECLHDESCLYLAALYSAEVGLAQAVRRLAVAESHPLPPIDLEVAISWTESRLDLELASAQKEAIRQACLNRLLVITGGPGVGKTTLIRSILEIFAAKRLDCVLAAPTGRAAKRLSETTGRGAKTLHRLLEFDPATGDFKRSAQHPLRGDLFVLDEVSMVDIVLAYKFFRAVPGAACVVLVGDVDQLPSVGPGSVLAELIASEVVPVVRLTEIFRQAKQSRIVAAAHEVNLGRLPALDHGQELEDFYFVQAEDPEAVERMVVKLVRERIPDRFGFDPQTEIQVLTPMNRSQLGTRNLNRVLQEALNPPPDKPEIERYGTIFRVGDRVIQTENSYDRDVFNGDQGLLTSINRIEQEATIAFDGRGVVYEFRDLDELQLAYALSIHKSQGSEYPSVVIPVHTQHYIMLQRNLLYTAITRGKRLVVLVGTTKALGMAVRRQDTARRCTALGWRLQNQASRV